jgi:hypothetical protein
VSLSTTPPRYRHELSGTALVSLALADFQDHNAGAAEVEVLDALRREIHEGLNVVEQLGVSGCAGPPPGVWQRHFKRADP